MRDTKLGATFLFATFAALTLESEALAGRCKWRVEGDVKVVDNLWAKKNDPTVSVERGLEGAKVRIMAATLPGLFVPWGEVSVDQKGHYGKTVTPAESDPIGCALPRFFRVLLVLENDKVKIAPEFPPLAPGLPAMFPAWVWPLSRDAVAEKPPIVKGVRTVKFSETFSELKEGKPTDLGLLPDTDGALYNMTRAAQMFWGYQRTYDKMLALKLEPIKVNVVWPSGVGSKTDLGFSDPVIDHTRIRKSWFGQGWGWVQRELTHEYIHQWFNKKVYEPPFLTGRNPSTHDFLESAPLAFYEAAAEFAAVGLNQLTFDKWSSDTEEFGRVFVLTRRGLYRRFAKAHAMNPETAKDDLYYKAEELRALIKSNSTEWHKDLNRAEAAVANHLRLLILDRWHDYDFGSDDLAKVDLTGTDDIATPASRVPRDCSKMPHQMFKFEDVMRKMVQWRGTIAADRWPLHWSLAGFYSYLAVAKPSFAGNYRALFHAFGNPHSGNNAWDICPSRFKPAPPSKTK